MKKKVLKIERIYEDMNTPEKRENINRSAQRPVEPVVMEVIKHTLKSNGLFSIMRDVYDKKSLGKPTGKQYIDVLDHETGNINSLQIYRNKTGLYFSKQGYWYLDQFTKTSEYVPYQVEVR